MKGLTILPVEKQHQLAIDGPKTNWKILRLIMELRDKEENPPLQDIGSCGLHVVSGALYTGVVACLWPLEKLLRAMFKFLHNSPAWRAEHLRVSSSSLYPEKFCATRCVENEIVVSRAIDISEDFVKLIKLYVAKAPSKQPKYNISYNNLKEYHTNPLIVFYLHLFRDVAARLNCFLIKFQTDGLMIPFFGEEISGILRCLMGFFIRKETLKTANSTKKLSKLQVSDESNWRLKTDIKLTTTGAESLKKVPSHLHQGLKKSWVLMLEGMIEKIQEPSPISCKLVQVSATLDSVKMALLQSQTEESLFNGIVDIMYSNKRISSKQGDVAKEQFDDFLQKIVKCNNNSFANFDKKNTRVVECLGFYVNPEKVYPDFWYVCKFVFTLSHGQSAVERGFNINKQILVDNLGAVSLTSLRTVYDKILHHGSIR